MRRAVADVGLQERDPVLDVREIRPISGIREQIDRHDASRQGDVCTQWRTKFEPMNPAAPVTRSVDIRGVYGLTGTQLSARRPVPRGRSPRPQGLNRRERPDPAPATSSSPRWSTSSWEAPSRPVSLAADTPPVGADHDVDVHVGERRILDELADAAEVPGDELGLGQCARREADLVVVVGRGCVSRARRREPGAPGASPGTSRPHRSESVPFSTCTVTSAGSTFSDDGTGGLAEGPQPGDHLIGLGLLGRPDDRLGTTDSAHGSVTISSAPGCVGSTLRNVLTSRRMSSRC